MQSRNNRQNVRFGDYINEFSIWCHINESAISNQTRINLILLYIPFMHRTPKCTCHAPQYVEPSPWPEMADIINILIRCEFAYHVEFGFICEY